MGSYVFLTVFSALVLFVAPFCAFSTQNTTQITPTQTAPLQTDDAVETDAVKTDVFKVKNVETDEVFTYDTADFLIGIVSCEMSASAPAEALKAQAVAAYTYYCKQRAAAKDGTFSNVPDTFFTYGTKEGLQARWGDAFQKNYDAIKNAVSAVQGEQILYENQPITACYHAISAGLTERAADVWGGDYPYLIPVDSFGDLQAKDYETTVTVSTADLTAALQSSNANFQPQGEPDEWFAQPDTTDSGFVKTVAVCGTVFKGTDIRRALSLRSACFTTQCKDDAFTFTVRGYGHNVGMSQAGAVYMANLGADYREILGHYYPHTTII